LPQAAQKDQGDQSEAGGQDFGNGTKPIIGLESSGVKKRQEPGDPALPGLESQLLGQEVHEPGIDEDQSQMQNLIGQRREMEGFIKPVIERHCRQIKIPLVCRKIKPIILGGIKVTGEIAQKPNP
jgi:hypothetical protein